MKNQNKSFFYLLAAIVCFGYAVNFFFGKGKDENNENNESNEAIELVRQSKIELSGLGGFLNQSTTTWGDYANKEIADNPTKKYIWKAANVEDGLYLVSFVDEEGWGKSWEADIKNKMVKDINRSAYLSWKYGFSRCDRSGVFQVCDVTVDTLKYKNRKLTYQLKGSIFNNSGKSITSLSFSNSNVLIIFKEKEVRNKAYSWKCNSTAVSSRVPWKNQTKINFSILIDDIEAVYLDYDPEAVLFTLEIEAEDPVGYDYDKGIYEIDLLSQWKRLQKQMK